MIGFGFALLGFLNLYLAHKPLKILINTGLSTRSHIRGILDIGTELREKGHDIHFAAATRFKSFSDGYGYMVHELQDMKDEDFAGVLPYLVIMQRAGRGLETLNFSKEHFEFCYIEYITSFPDISELLSREKFDLVICDLSSLACRDAANDLKIPMIVGLPSSYALNFFRQPYMNYDQYSSPITTEHMSILERLRDVTLKQYEAYKIHQFHTRAINRGRSKFGISPNYSPYGPIDKNLLLSVSFTGFEPAFPAPPNLYTLGPIFSHEAKPLGKELEDFLSTRKRVVYVAFGSLSELIPEDIDDMTNGMDILLNDTIDGVIWGLGRSKIEKKINPNILVLPWAPQSELLNHSNVKLFVSHCGIFSVFETIHAMKPILCFPFFGDQPINSAKILESGIGLRYHRDAQDTEALAHLSKKLLKDEDGKYYANLLKLKTIFDLRSSRGKQDSANVIEEYVYTAQACRPYQKDGELPCEVSHLIPASHRMNFFKAHNLDIYLIVLVVAVITFMLIVKMVLWFVGNFSSTNIKIE